MKIWLASGSPRRRQLLEWVGATVSVHPQDIDETVQVGEEPVPYALRMAHEKAANVSRTHLALAADTIVHLDGRVFGKPTNRNNAIEILTTLSGQWHTVTTAICLKYRDKCCLEAIHTRVRLRELSPVEIQQYVASGEADDKAGAYGIQGRAGVFIAEVQGSWTNVMGLPVERVLQVIDEWGLD